VAVFRAVSPPTVSSPLSYAAASQIPSTAA
jgi:hypothetical protein